LIVALLLGCASGPDADWLGPSPDETRPCGEPASSGQVDAALALRVVVGDDVRAVDAAALTRGLRRYFLAYGLDFVLAAPPVWIDDRPLLAGPAGASFPDDAAQAAALYGPLREVVGEVATPRRDDEVVLVVMSDLLAPGSAAARVLTEVRGLGFAPGPEAAEVLGFEEFTPVALVAWGEVGRYPEGGRAAMVAHEVGHALGLAHVTDPDNLMAVRAFRCVPFLDSSQTAQLRRVLSLEGP
jgi:hypothetical protein